ncbi:hypothetical protein AB0N14_09295 [Streptomyces sp. NPDC051104]|uniref:hypothetical protein n=1 Tax=Streptomyces sp. NPDC051104 TaxID=3155044 RepID=UPI00344840CA
MEQVGDKPEEVRRHLEEEQQQFEEQQPSRSGVRPEDEVGRTVTDEEAEQTAADDAPDVSGRGA